ncbi:MAG: hypothetical protein FDX02_01580 [Chlorobium sp.]|nr:MAG: hypothetical protein FDX02_01580 [Chlorobium sp.]
MDKRQALLELAVKRKQTPPPEGSFRIGKYHEGIYECDHVSPYTKGADNVNAEIFVLLQDWGSNDEMSLPVVDLEKQKFELRYGRTPGQETNNNLEPLLKQYFSINLDRTYATNLFPYIKGGEVSAEISDEDLRWAAKEFALPQIAIVQPKLVICCGKDTFNAVRVAAGEKEVETVEEGINASFSLYGSQIWLQSHPGWMGQSNRKRYSGNADQVNDDWEKMAASFPGLCSEQ